MPTSTEIAQLFSTQQQAFQQQSTMANMVGISNPALNVGAFGSWYGSGMQPGPGGAPPIYDYGSGGMTHGYGGGSRFGAGVMSGMAGLGTAAGMGLGVASMFGKLGAIAPLIDPVAGFMAGFGGLSAAGIGAGLAGAALPLALTAGVGAFGSNFMRGGREGQAVAGQLGQFNFFNPMSRSGMGFTREDSHAISGSMRQLSLIPEMMTSMEELTRMLPSMRRMGMMQGVKDASEFAQKFKESVQTINKMAQFMGTTMEEAAKFFEHSRSMGFTTRQGQITNMLNAQLTSGLTGMNMGQVMQMQAGGAQQAMGIGASRRLGAEGVTNIANRIAMARDSGVISNELLTDVTGMEGPEAEGAAAQKFYGILQNLSSSPAGKAMMLGMMKRDASGKVVLDQDLLQSGPGLDELKRRGGRLSSQDKMAFVRQMPNLIAQLAGQGDIGSFVQGLVGDKGPDAAGLALNQLAGGSLSVADQDALLRMGGGGGGGVNMQNLAAVRSREGTLMRQTDPSALWKRLKTKVDAGAFGGVRQMGDDFQNYLGKAYDNFIDDLIGRQVIQLSKEGAKAFSESLSGGTTSKAMKELFAAAHGMRPGNDGNLNWAGRGLKLAAMGIVGLGVGAFTGGIGGGIAAAATGAALQGMDSWNPRETEFANRIFSDDYSTGRTTIGEFNYARRMVGGRVGGRTVDTINRLADQGRFVTDRGRQASDDVEALKRDLSKSGTFADPQTSDSKRRDMLRSAMAQSVSKDLYRLAVEHGSGANASPDMIASMLENNNVGAIETLTGISMEQAATKLGGTRAGRLLGAMQSGRGSLIDDYLTGGLASVVQKKDRLFVSLAKAAGSYGAAGRALDVKMAQQMRRDAEEKLSNTNLSSTAQSVLRGNSKVRAMLGAFHSGAEDVGDMIMLRGDLGNDAEAAAALSKKLGIEVTAEDVRSARMVMSESGGKKGVGEAIAALSEAQNASDAQVIKDKIADVAVQITKSSESIKGVPGQAAQEFAAAMKTLGEDFNEGNFDKVSSSMGSLITKYKGMGAADQKALVLALGPMGKALQAGVTAGSRLGRKVSLDQLRAQGLTDAQLGTLSADAAGNVTVDSAVRQMVERSVAATGVAKTAGIVGGAADTGHSLEQEMVDALGKISQNSDLQTTALMMVVEKFNGSGMDAALKEKGIVLNGLTGKYEFVSQKRA